MKINGIKELQRRIERASVEIQNEVKEIIAFNTKEIELQATRDAPGPGAMIATKGGLVSERAIRGEDGKDGITAISQAIGMDIINNGFTGKVYVDKSAGDIAAWVEFGTGQSAKAYLLTVPKEWRDLARQYYVNGRGTIIESAYLYPAFMKFQAQAFKEMEKAVKNVKL